MSSEKKRVQFRAPDRLIDRADVLAEVLGEARTDVLVTALREYLHEATHDDALTQEVAAAYCDDVISYEQLESLGIAGQDIDLSSLCLERDNVAVPEAVVEELREVASYDDVHGDGAGRVLGRTDDLSVRARSRNFL